ncbi:MAG: cytosolic protein [Alicyclobacillus shizuokensis]|nr:cytosolic protein [Alicyclobacillus shizuokensis]
MPIGADKTDQRAYIRELLQGACDTHIHVEPDLLERQTDDLSLARYMLSIGWHGFVLKSHYFPTVERAQVVNRAVPGAHAYGAIALNHSVGGFNPVAVDLAGRAGARIVWLPTVDAANESTERQRQRGEHRVPFWARIQQEIREKGISPAPLTVFDENGELRSDLRTCLGLVADYGMALATGHLDRDEIFTVVREAKRAGVDHVVVTHALFPAEALTIEEQVELADLGALIEHCYTTFYTGKCDWDTLFDSIRAVGPDRCVLSSDLGQKVNPPIVDGLINFAERLLAAGFQERDVQLMMVDNTRRLVDR